MDLPYNVRRKLNEVNAYTLAYHAGTANPASLDSPGAKMMTRILADVVERVEYLTDGDALADADSLRDALADEVHEVADSAPDVYTHARWEQFVDLCAYNVDLSDYGVESIDLSSTSLTDVAAMALYGIARDVADAAVTLIGDALEAHIAGAETRAAALGAVHGRSAAEWLAQDTFGGRSTGDAVAAARRLLAGIDEGDPETMDSLPTADFSGEWADGYTVEQLLADVDLAGLDPLCDIASELTLVSYGDAFGDAVVEHAESLARSFIGC